MMAHDTGPMPPNAIAEQTVERVRGALERYVRASSGPSLSTAPEPPSELRTALRDLAYEARQKEVAPEHLLVVLKGVWFALPEVQAAKEQGEQTRILQQVVTLCIKEYFAA